MRSVFRRLTYGLRQRERARELAEEMETHRLLAEERLRETGMQAAEAAAASRRIMGNLTLAREDARTAWIPQWVDAFRQDVAFTLRTVRRAPVFTGALILVMATGIGATAGVFSLVDSLVLKSLPVRDPRQLVYFQSPSFSYPIFTEVRARSGAIFSAVAAWSLEEMHVAWGGELEPSEVLTASGSFYDMLGIDAVRGRTFAAADDALGGGPDGLVAVISHAAWQRRFGGSPAAIGTSIRIDDLSYTIIGVTPPSFFGVTPGVAPEVTIPLTSNQDREALERPTSSWVHIMARMRDGTSLAEANVVLQGFWPAVMERTTNPGMPADRREMYLRRATTLESARAGFSRVRNRFEEPLWLLFGLVSLLLTVACASAANLLLARSAGRRREIAVRLAIGAGRGRLVRQMITESVVLTTLAAVVGLLIASWGAAALVKLMTTKSQAIAIDAALNWRVAGFSLILALVTAAACAVVPALRATRVAPLTSLKDTGQVPHAFLGRWSSGRLLVAAQVGLTVLLLSGAALFVRSLDRVLSQDAGVDRRGVLLLSTDAEAAGYEGDRIAAFYDRLLERLAGIPGVESASLSTYPPISDDDGAWTQSIAIDGAPVTTMPGRSTVYFNRVSPGFFRTVGIRLVRGRGFASGDTRSAPRVVIINDTLARRYFPDQDALGRLITIGRSENRQDLIVIGVAANAKYQRLQEEPRSIAYLPLAQHEAENLFAEIRTFPASSVGDEIRREVRALDAVVPMRIETVADRIRESLVTERVMAILASALAVAALTLACASLYGLLAYAVARQTKEIGVRLALGADRRRVVRMVMAETLALAAVGVLLGMIGSLSLGRFASSLLFQVSPRDPLSLAAAAALMLTVAVVAGFLPARRAARVDPVIALRAE